MMVVNSLLILFLIVFANAAWAKDYYQQEAANNSECLEEIVPRSHDKLTAR